MNKKPRTLRDLLSKKLQKSDVYKYLKTINEAMFDMECKLIPDNLKSDKQRISIAYREIKNLGNALSKPKEYSLENIGITLAALGLTLVIIEGRNKE